jgi:hypothetical protein
MPRRLSSRNDPNSIVAFDINDRQNNATNQTNRDESFFTVVHRLIDRMNSEDIIEHIRRIGGRNAMLDRVRNASNSIISDYGNPVPNPA